LAGRLPDSIVEGEKVDARCGCEVGAKTDFWCWMGLFLSGRAPSSSVGRR
jgi:hypothetical protein